jgi:hypothetical protein
MEVEVTTGRRAGRHGAGGGHHTLHRQACGFQRGQRSGQARAVRHRHPAALAGHSAFGQGEMQVLVVFQQRLFHHPQQGRAQASRRGLGQVDAVPADIAFGQHQHGLVGARQQGRGGAALLGDAAPIRAEHEAPLRRQLQRRARVGRGIGAASGTGGQAFTRGEQQG